MNSLNHLIVLFKVYISFTHHHLKLITHAITQLRTRYARVTHALRTRYARVTHALRTCYARVTHTLRTRYASCAQGPHKAKSGPANDLT